MPLRKSLYYAIDMGHDRSNDSNTSTASLSSLDAKLNVVISKVALLERDEESVFDRLDDLRKGQIEIIRGQTAATVTLSNEILSIHQRLKSQDSPTRGTRYLLAFTGGLVGGVAGGALMMLLLKIGSVSQNPAALAFLDLFR